MQLIPGLIPLLLAGCAASAPSLPATPAGLPPRPMLPEIPPDALMCLSDETYAALVKRDRLRRHYAETLEILCTP